MTRTFRPKGLTIYQTKRGLACSIKGRGRTGATMRSHFSSLSPARRKIVLAEWDKGRSTSLPGPLE